MLNYIKYILTKIKLQNKPPKVCFEVNRLSKNTFELVPKNGITPKVKTIIHTVPSSLFEND